MRVIAGKFRSRRLLSVPGLDVRPTPDRLREALFNVLTPCIEDAVFVDAYAGSGAVGIEALSRGARQVILIEKSAAALKAIENNLAALGIGREAVMVRGNAASLISKYAADIVFLDPPYQQTKAYADCLEALAKGTCQLAIAQHESRLRLEDHYESLRKYRMLKQGDNSLSFFDRRPAADECP
ncbi:MAG TPA: 16S rRNA (guanine(966)-N(2))-methyltransferase RsmD [Bryobacteraceae bacterium]|jgi:16S rRNA (guanine(966)-N(2))-methyltransferase RsmD|nr:16S rRNA (guanine(966)-N(2))-methyltransferase RsmD [Bryobacteraceae bacterium]